MILRELQSVDSWPFLLQFAARRTCHEDGAWEQYLGDLTQAPHDFWRKSHTIPQGFAKERIILQLFSGRRRPGDFQFYLEQATPPGTLLWTIGLDIGVDSRHGELMDEGTGALCGPPCETQPLRDTEAPASGQLRQLFAGSQLLLFSLESLILMAIHGGLGLMEHPSEPGDQTQVSVWLATLRYCVAARKIRIYQGHYGAESAKPKDLLSINLVTLSRRLEEFKLYMNIPKGVTVGKGEQSEFLTGRLKEYPPMLNKALANSFSGGLSDRLCIDDGMELTATFVEVCRKLVLSNFSQTMGPDFAG